MKRIALILGILLQFCLTYCQDVKNLFPSYVRNLDFSENAKAEWALRDTLLEQLSSGTKDWDSFTSIEQTILNKYGEVFINIWDIVGEGCSWYCGGGPEKVTASSHLKSQGSNSYLPKNAHDLNYKNAWVEGVSGYGIGEYLTYSFAPTSPRITEIIVVNGYVKSKSAYRNNSRVKKLKVYLNDEPYAILNLEDKIANQGFKVKPIGNSERADWEILESKSGWTLKFEILEVYKGLKYDDVVISEIYFDGIDVHCFAKGTKILMADLTTKNIEDLQIGDFVAQMELKTNQIKPAKIEKLNNAMHHALVTYKFESGLKITATQDHPFYITNKGWASLKPEKSNIYKGFKNIKKITVGDNFITESGIDKLIAIDYLVGDFKTFTISKLNQGYNFIANGFVVGVEEIE